MKKNATIILPIAIVMTIAIGFLVPREISRWGKQVEERRRIEQQEADNDAWVQRHIIDALKAPPEAINDMFGRNQISRIRTDMYAAHGIEKVLHIREQESGRNFVQTSFDEDPEMKMTPTRYAVEDSIEHCLRQRAVDACIQARGYKNQNTSLSRYLKRHPDAWDKEIRPRLWLIVQSKGASYSFRFMAARALADGDDRSPALREWLTKVVQLDRHEDDVKEAIRILRDRGWPVPEPWPSVSDLPTLYADELNEGASSRPQKVVFAVSFDGIPQLLENIPGEDAVYIGVKLDPVLKDNQWQTNPLELLCLDMNTGQSTAIVLNESAHVLTAGVDAKRGLLATHEQIINEQVQEKEYAPKRCHLLLRNLKTGELLGNLGPTHDIKSLHFNPYSDRLVAVEVPNTISIYDTANHCLLYRFALSGMSQPVFVPQRPLAVVASSRNLNLWDEQLRMLPVCFNKVEYDPVPANPMRSNLLVTLNGHKVTVWDLSVRINLPYTSNELKRISSVRCQLKSCSQLTTAALAPCAKLVVVSQENDMLILDTDGKPRGRLSGHKGQVLDLRFAGNKLISTGRDKMLLVWDWAKVAAWCDRGEKTN